MATAVLQNRPCRCRMQDADREETGRCWSAKTLLFRSLQLQSIKVITLCCLPYTSAVYTQQTCSYTPAWPVRCLHTPTRSIKQLTLQTAKSKNQAIRADKSASISHAVQINHVTECCTWHSAPTIPHHTCIHLFLMHPRVSNPRGCKQMICQVLSD